jgi:hypothetical protein
MRILEDHQHWTFACKRLDLRVERLQRFLRTEQPLGKLMAASLTATPAAKEQIGLLKTQFDCGYTTAA